MPPFQRMLIANRGEIALRIAAAARDLGVSPVMAYSADDRDALHARAGDSAVALEGVGPRAYLDIDAIVRAALGAGCDALHPGYGFLSENAGLARACQAAGVVFVGPSPETLTLFGDKAEARGLAGRLGVPVARATPAGISAKDAIAFQAELGGADILLKAAAGGGGRGMRRLVAGADPAADFEACRKEAEGAFGDGRLYAEQFLPAARHVEVQVLGDGRDVIALHDRECSIQRRHQKIIEFAPALDLPPATREALRRAALDLAAAVRLQGLATMEFLVDALDPNRFIFIEANPRLQVEHTVTEAVTGLDLVQLQVRAAAGESLADLGLGGGPPPVRGCAVQMRVNLETLEADGGLTPGAGEVITRWEPPGGPGVRVDGCGFGGWRTNPAFDPLVAKVIVHSPSPDPALAAARAARAIRDFRLEGPASNLGLLQALLERPELVSGEATTRFVELNAGDLSRRAAALAPAALPVPRGERQGGGPADVPPPPEGLAPCAAPLRATLVGFEAAEGDLVRAGQGLAVLEAMKMQHVAVAPVSGRIVRLHGAPGDVMDEGALLALIEPSAVDGEAAEVEAEDPDRIRPDLARVIERHALVLDAARPEAVDRRHAAGQRTARENLDDLFDPGSFREFGALAIAAQKRRRSVEDLRARTPADGIVTGVGAVNGALFGEDAARCVGLAYDFTVLAGTQGHFSHKKTDRVLEFAEHWKTPVIWFTEGGGGRPGDVDVLTGASSLDTGSFTTFARLSGTVPRIAINSGRCFAGNAVFFGCADVTIATRDSNIGLGGPAMVEGGGLGTFTPDEIGPAEVQWRNGVLDLLVDDEASAVEAAKAILSMHQGPVTGWTAPDQRLLRRLVPENRLRVYDVRQVIETLADTGSWIELRGGYGAGMVTGFLRIEGRPMGVIANDPRRLGGAIDSEGAEKAGRFLQLCDAFGTPVLSLCDTPGFMVGPDSEATGAVRRGSRMFVIAAGMEQPFFTVVLRKGYGLGAQAMAAGDFLATAMTLAWPTAEFGPMGLEGAVRLGYRKELEAEADPVARQALFDRRLERMYQQGSAVSVAEALEIDAVIDPMETRDWLVRGMKAAGSGRRPSARRFVDVW